MSRSLEKMWYWLRFRNMSWEQGSGLQAPELALASIPCMHYYYLFIYCSFKKNYFLPGKVTVCKIERKLVKSWNQGQPCTKWSSSFPTPSPSCAVRGRGMIFKVLSCPNWILNQDPCIADKSKFIMETFLIKFGFRSCYPELPSRSCTWSHR